MRTLHIQSVDLVTDGLIVTYDDETRAFYDESVLMAHLETGKEAPARKLPRPVLPPATRSAKRSA
jgi:hypothetical protein